jgi:hypothetical protein
LRNKKPEISEPRSNFVGVPPNDIKWFSDGYYSRKHLGYDDEPNKLRLAQFKNADRWSNDMIAEFYGVDVDTVQYLLEYYGIR